MKYPPFEYNSQMSAVEMIIQCVRSPKKNEIFKLSVFSFWPLSENHREAEPVVDTLES